MAILPSMVDRFECIIPDSGIRCTDWKVNWLQVKITGLVQGRLLYDYSSAIREEYGSPLQEVMCWYHVIVILAEQ